jgi:hypothetical protein
MEPGDTRRSDHPKVQCALSVEDVRDVETYFAKKGGSESLYDEGLDVFGEAEDRSLAFCREFADWQQLQERGYLNVIEPLLSRLFTGVRGRIVLRISPWGGF